MAINYNALLVSDAEGWHSGKGTIYYRFLTTMPSYYEPIDTNDNGVDDSYDTDGDGAGDITIKDAANVAFSASEKALMLKAIAAWGAVANVNLQQGTASNSQITFGEGDIKDDTTYGFVSDFPVTGMGGGTVNGDLWINTGNDAQTNPVYGSDGWNTFLHELGHALGLRHPNEDPENEANDSRNNNQWTVMSYVPHPSQADLDSTEQAFPLTPMVLDIQAIQKLYGANFTTNTGNNNYVSGTGAKFAMTDGGFIGDFGAIFTIWDAGGTDTINASNQTDKVSINLAPGSYSTVGDIDNNIGLAAAVKNADGKIVNYIENAFGGSAGDILLGNATANKLYGNAGGDTIKGLGGADIIKGGSGADKLYGGTGGDEFAFTKLSDSKASTTGRDTIYDFDGDKNDFISLDSIDANANKSGNQAFKFIGEADFSKVAGQLHYVVGTSNTFVEADVNGDGKADFQIKISGLTDLLASDFIL
jgi:serralysin